MLQNILLKKNAKWLPFPASIEPGTATLCDACWIAVIGVPLVLTYTISIYWVFRGKVELTEENTQHVRQVLTEQGYEVAKIKIEDGMYEAYAKKDGKRYEVFLNGDFEIVEIELDD